MTTATASNFQWSDLARQSGRVGEALDEFGEVTVTRGSQVLRLSPQIPDPVVAATRDLCRLLTALVQIEAPDHVTKVLNSAWPWTRALPLKDQLELAREVGEAAEVSESLGTWRPWIDVVEDWRRTARAWADGATPVVINEALLTPAPRPV